MCEGLGHALHEAAKDFIHIVGFELTEEEHLDSAFRDAMMETNQSFGR